MSRQRSPLARAACRSERARRRVLIVLGVVGLSVSGCPERASTPPEALAPCREVGQRCEVSPGKLGSCVSNDNCKGPNCFICQSQH